MTSTEGRSPLPAAQPGRARRSVPGLRRMLPRDPEERHRAASSLELFFDLVFVVAVGFASENLHTIEAHGHVADGVAAYLLLFFAIWWAWMNFTWFATSFDTDDWLYRVTTILQMAGVLVLAAGTGPAMRHEDYLLATLGYVVMRLAMVSQWLRAAWNTPVLRGTAVRYAVGIAIVQVLWVLRLPVHAHPWGTVTFLVLVVAEVLVPIVAQRTALAPWHPRHIAERYGLFTLIVLGEGLVAAANAVIDAIAHTDHLASLLGLAVTGLLIVAGLWWIYFSREQHERLTTFPRSLVFGYGHYVVFAAAGALPAGIEVVLAWSSGTARISHTLAVATVTVPAALFVLAIWALALRHTLGRVADLTIAGLAVLVALSAFVPSVALVATTVLLAGIVVVLEVARNRPRVGG